MATRGPRSVERIERELHGLMERRQNHLTWSVGKLKPGLLSEAQYHREAPRVAKRIAALQAELAMARTHEPSLKERYDKSPRTYYDRWRDGEIFVDIWEERDRLSITVTDQASGTTLAEWWDDDARSMLEEGFFRPNDPAGRTLPLSVIEYLDRMAAH